MYTKANFLTEVVENLYKHGTATLNIIGHKIEYYIDNEGHLKMHTIGFKSNNHGELDCENGINFIALLVSYTTQPLLQSQNRAYIELDKESIHYIAFPNQDKVMLGINELYSQIMPMIRTSSDYIKSVVESDYNKLITLAKYNPNITSLELVTIMNSLIDDYNEFDHIVKQAYNLYDLVVKSNSEYKHEEVNRYNAFLNDLYLKELKAGRKIVTKNSTPIIEGAIDLTNQDFSFNPAVGREEEIKELEIALLTPNKSALIIGKPGVGKTALVEGLAYNIRIGNIPNKLKNKRIIKISTNSLIAGTIYRGAFEEKIKILMDKIKQDGNIILFIDEIHTIMGAGANSNSANDFANILKPYIDRGDDKIIGCTTEEEYEKYIQRDKALSRRFQKVMVEEPNITSLYNIICYTIKKLEITTDIKWNLSESITNLIIDKILYWTDEKHRNFKDERYNPEIAICILDNAFAYAEFNENGIVTIDNIISAIERSTFLYDTAKNNFIEDLKSIVIQDKSRTRNRIITLPLK